MCGVPYLLIVGTADRTAPRWWRRTAPGSDKGAKPSLECLQQSKHHHTFYLLHDGQVVHAYILSLQDLHRSLVADFTGNENQLVPSLPIWMRISSGMRNARLDLLPEPVYLTCVLLLWKQMNKLSQ